MSKKSAPNGSELPRWNLAELYSGIQAPELRTDMENIERMVQDFKKRLENGIDYLSGADLGRAIAEYEKIEILRGKIACYVALIESDDIGNCAKTAALKKWDTDVWNNISFFSGEICEMKEPDLITKLIAPELARYAPWIARQRQMSRIEIPEGIDDLSSRYQDINMAAWRRLYMEAKTQPTTDYQGKRISIDQLQALSTDEKSTPAARAAARKKLGETLKQENGKMALIYNAVMKDMEIDARLAKHHRPDQAVHLENGMDQEIVDTMFNTVKTSFTGLSHRFYAWAARKNGAEVIKSALLKEPSSIDGGNDEKIYSWPEAKAIVMRAFKNFSPRFARVAQRLFSEQHIDAGAREGKEGGGFCMPVGPGHLPFILVNFTGTSDDVASTLGHELGHGIQQALTERARGSFLSEISPDLSETASVFAEMLVFDELLKSEKDPQQRRLLLEKRVENILLSSLQQLSYYDFEHRVHAEIKNGPIDAERISDIWIETKKQYYGPAIELDECDRYGWATVTHFFEMPFYVHSYSFAQITVNALFEEYKKAQEKSPEAAAKFVDNYTSLLETGITRNMYEIFLPFGLDPELPEFWESGLSLMKKYLDELIQGDSSAPAAKAAPPVKKPPAPGL